MSKRLGGRGKEKGREFCDCSSSQTDKFKNDELQAVAKEKRHSQGRKDG